jgi:hypothetical protein
MRICITRSEKFVYSETFIRDQINVISKLGTVYTIHSGRLPERNEDDRLLAPKIIWLLHKIAKVFFGRNNYFGNYGIKKFLKDDGHCVEDNLLGIYSSLIKKFTFKNIIDIATQFYN